MKILIDENIRIELIKETHAKLIFEMVDQNRTHLREWLPIVYKIPSIEFAESFVKGSIQSNEAGVEHALGFFEYQQAIGRIGVYKIDNQNRIGEIGYWIVENSQGKGIITKACKVMIDFCFNDLDLNRIEIKCATANLRSKAIPEKLDFSRDGVIRQGEFVHDKFFDLALYSLLKSDKMNSVK